MATMRELNTFAHNEFMLRVQGVLPKDKYLQFKNFYWPPVPTVDITERGFMELGRALEAENQYIRSEFGNPENATEFENYRVEIDDTLFWGSNGFEASKTAVNSIIIVDVAQTQLTERPQPYYYLKEIAPSLIHDVDFKPDGQAEYVLFYGDNGANKDIIYAYDETYYRIFQRKDNTSEYSLISESQHSIYDARGKRVSGIGYCPARRFWKDLLAKGDNVQAKGPLAKVFGKLYEYVFDFVSVRYFGAYGKWPFIWEFENTAPKHIYPLNSAIVCQQGKWIVPQPAQQIGNKTVEQKALVVECTECQKSAYIGPGTIKRVSAPSSSTSPDLRKPVDFINPDVNILKAVRDALKEDEDNIVEAMVGFGGENTNGQARNEKDVEAGFEGKVSYLIRFKRNFEAAHKWTLETLAMIMFDNDFLRVTVDYGNEFYLKSPELLEQQYTDSKAGGLPDYQLAPLRDLISETRYRSNDEQRMRQRILASLQPYPDRTDGDLQAWVTAYPEMLSAELLRIRLNFDAYIRRFEREQQISIVDFGSKIAFNLKIDAIFESLIEYAAADAEKALQNTTQPSQTPNQNQPTLNNNTFSIGQRVRVIPGKEHEMGGVKMGGAGTVKIVDGNAYGIELDSMPGMVHKWYVAEELEAA